MRPLGGGGDKLVDQGGAGDAVGRANGPRNGTTRNSSVGPLPTRDGHGVSDVSPAAPQLHGSLRPAPRAAPGRIDLPHPVINPLFVPLVAVVLQCVCMHCSRLRLSPFYINYVISGPRDRLRARVRDAAAPFSGSRPYPCCAGDRPDQAQPVGGVCSHCQFCRVPQLCIRSQGLTILARPMASPGSVAVPVPAVIWPAGPGRGHLCHSGAAPHRMRPWRQGYASDADLHALGFSGGGNNHPSHAVLSSLLVLPPVSRPGDPTSA